MNRTMQQLQEREAHVFSTIPGMKKLLQACPDEFHNIETQYPDAAFALRIATELFHHDRNLSLITQRAYFSILDGVNIASVRHRYSKEMDLYVQSHMWDD